MKSKAKRIKQITINLLESHAKLIRGEIPSIEYAELFKDSKKRISELRRNR